MTGFVFVNIDPTAATQDAIRFIEPRGIINPKK
jgi:hypothetical protein